MLLVHLGEKESAVRLQAAADVALSAVASGAIERGIIPETEAVIAELSCR